MKITKLVHSCVLIENNGQVVLFDPGFMSAEMVRGHNLLQLDEIFITHEHADHMDVELIKELSEKFPYVRIVGNSSVIAQLEEQGIAATNEPGENIVFFNSPHESVEPLFPTPEQQGFHYENAFSHPGDSHGFSETMPILALPVTAPWGATVTAVNLAITLKPQYVLPIHDWHWNDDARLGMYDVMSKAFEQNGITFIKAINGEAFELDV